MSAPKIEEDIVNELSSEDQSIALDFVDYLYSNALEFVRDNGDCWKDKIYYHVTFQTKCVCFIAINDPDEKDNHWTVWFQDMDSDFMKKTSVEKDIQVIAWNHVDICGNCGSCGGGRRKNIFGKEFEKVCGCIFRIDNPNAEESEFMKKMVEIKKCEILSKWSEEV